jgi:hypothetical protein
VSGESTVSSDASRAVVLVLVVEVGRTGVMLPDRFDEVKKIGRLFAAL